MDIEGFLLTSGFALIVVLIGWSSQITTRSRETKDIEREFIKKANLKDDQYKNITQKKGTVESSIVELVDFLYSQSDEDNLKIFDKTNRIKSNLPILNRNYFDRFWILLITSFSLISTGIIAIFLPNNFKFLALLPNLFFVLIMIYNLITTHRIETEYSQDISEAMDKL